VVLNYPFSPNILHVFLISSMNAACLAHHLLNFSFTPTVFGEDFIDEELPKYAKAHK
jgi:hypothetical protein